MTECFAINPGAIAGGIFAVMFIIAIMTPLVIMWVAFMKVLWRDMQDL